MPGIKIMTLGEFRDATKMMPDDAEIVIDEGDLEFFEVRVRGHLSPSRGYPWVIWLEMGQPVTADKDLDRRIDEYLEDY